IGGNQGNPNSIKSTKSFTTCLDRCRHMDGGPYLLDCVAYLIHTDGHRSGGTAEPDNIKPRSRHQKPGSLLEMFAHGCKRLRSSDLGHRDTGREHRDAVDAKKFLRIEGSDPVSGKRQQADRSPATYSCAIFRFNKLPTAI